MEEKIVYGMLMKRMQINNECYMFSPVHLIKGELMSENVFVDELSNHYAIISDNNDYNQSIIYDSDEYCIGFYIKEEQLLRVYSLDGTIENAKMEFFDEMKNNCAFVYYSTGHEKFQFMSFDLNTFCENFEENNLDDSTKIEKEEIVIPKESPINQDEEYVVINKVGIDSFINYMNTKEYDKLLGVLKEMRDSFGEVEKEESAEKQVQVKEKVVPEPKKDEIDVKDFYLKTRKKIIDQDDALLDIITAVKMDQYAENPSDRSRCFIIGPTGSGKTEILKTLGEYLDKPFIKIDTTQLTTPGYVGGTIEQQLLRLIHLSNGDIKKAENGIVVFDEIDKKCNSRDELFGKGFLFTLLPFLDGTDYTIPVGIKENQIFNTSNLTVFASGSFLEIIKNHSLEKKSIGFNSEIKTENITKSKIEAEEIFKMSGMPDEFIGRFPVVVQLNELSTESLIKILEQSEISQLQAEKRKLKHLGVDLSWEEKYVEAVAIEAKKLNRGARSLKKIVEKTIKYMRREILMNDNKYSSAILLEETVQNPKIYKLK